MSSDYEDIFNVIYNRFEKLCYHADLTELETFIDLFKIDVNHDDGIYLDIICERDNIELLELFIKHGADVHLYDDSLLRSAMHAGRIEMVDYLIHKCLCDYKTSYGTTAYSNSEATKNYIDSL